MPSTATDILDGLSSRVAIKGPCACATTVNIALSGEQTIDGVLTDESRVLVMDQTDPRENGIYRSSTGDWERVADFRRNDDVVTGTTVLVVGGTQAGFYSVTTAGDIEFDASNITWATFLSLIGFAPLASPVFTGNPTAPTAAPGDNDLSIANTAFVTAAIAAAILALIGGAPAGLDTLGEIATAIGNDAAFATTIQARYAQAARASKLYMFNTFGALR